MRVDKLYSPCRLINLIICELFELYIGILIVMFVYYSIKNICAMYASSEVGIFTSSVNNINMYF